MDRYITGMQKGFKTHEDAKNKTAFYLKSKYKLMIRLEYPILLNSGYRHSYDLVGFVDDDELSFYDDGATEPTKISIRKLIELNDQELIDSEYKELLDRHVVVVAEIDNLTSHSHTEHKIADNIAQDTASKLFSTNLAFIRLLKEEVNGQEKDMLKYFADKVDYEIFMRLGI